MSDAAKQCSGCAHEQHYGRECGAVELGEGGSGCGCRRGALLVKQEPTCGRCGRTGAAGAAGLCFECNEAADRAERTSIGFDVDGYGTTRRVVIGNREVQLELCPDLARTTWGGVSALVLQGKVRDVDAAGNPTTEAVVNLTFDPWALFALVFRARKQRNKVAKDGPVRAFVAGAVLLPGGKKP